MGEGEGCIIEAAPPPPTPITDESNVVVMKEVAGEGAGADLLSCEDANAGGPGIVTDEMTV